MQSRYCTKHNINFKNLQSFVKAQRRFFSPFIEYSFIYFSFDLQLCNIGSWCQYLKRLLDYVIGFSVTQSAKINLKTQESCLDRSHTKTLCIARRFKKKASTVAVLLYIYSKGWQFRSFQKLKKNNACVVTLTSLL